MDQKTLVYLAAGLGFVIVAGVTMFAVPADGGRENQKKRLKQITEASTRRSAGADTNAVRRKQIQDSMKSLREREAKRRKDVNTKSLADQIKQSGLAITLPAFWLGSLGLGLAAAFIAFVAGMQYPVVAAAAFAAGLGLPRWMLAMAISRRQKQFAEQFADAIDIVVRGVKSGLPLIECLRVIARESPQPLAGEFERVVDGIQMGSTVEAALERMHVRMPLAEVNFFNIVINIQQQAGGNLSEALGNLSGVLRSRKMLKEKIKALSSEAKASAFIIGSLPIAVMLLVYTSTPSYIMELFTNDVGHVILAIGAGLMGTGIFVMRQMINFEV